ncbi:protein linear polyubiquitination, partial [Pristimantis euphronides]
MACGGPAPSSPLLTVLVSARAWLQDAASGQEAVQLQLSVEPERPGDFRLSVRRSQAAPRGPTGAIIGDFQLTDIFYVMKTPRCHELIVLQTSRVMIFQFDDEREAQKWWTVVNSSQREARKVAQSQKDILALRPAEKNRPTMDAAGCQPSSTEAELLITPTDLCTKEDLALLLSRSIEAGDQRMAAQYATDLARQKVPLQIQLKPHCYPKTEICMKVGVEDATASVNISTYVNPHTTVAILKQQIFREYQFHPGIQRWIIGQCLCSDDRTVASYGIRKDGDTAFLYLLGGKQAKLAPQDQYTSNIYPPYTLLPCDERAKYNTVPSRSSPKSGVPPCFRPEKMEAPQQLHLDLRSLSLQQQVPAAPPSPAQPGWSCPQCTFINKPTRPGCEMCSADRPADYVVPEKYKPDETERRRLQLEKDSYQQYRKALEEERQQNFLHLLQLENEVLIPNQEPIECRICYSDVPAGDGVLLRECLHSFCRECLRQVVNCCEDPEVSCPFRDDTYACDRKLQQREVRALVSADEYTRFLERGLVVAESRSQNSYHCRTADCKGWCIYEDSVNEFICPICTAQNCLICKAIHDGMNCKEYQDDLRIRAQNDAAAKQTSDMLK